jgi:hypothetical protein
MSPNDAPVVSFGEMCTLGVLISGFLAGASWFPGLCTVCRLSVFRAVIGIACPGEIRGGEQSAHAPERILIPHRRPGSRGQAHS